MSREMMVCGACWWQATEVTARRACGGVRTGIIPKRHRVECGRTMWLKE